jgi:hypothetical protein
MCENGSGDLPTENHGMDAQVIAAARELGFIAEDDDESDDENDDESAELSE